MDMERSPCTDCGKPTLLSRGDYPACRNCKGTWNTEPHAPPSKQNHTEAPCL